MSTPSSEPIRIFVSHSHEDDDYCREFVEELRRLLGDRDAVWYDEHNLTSGELLREIQRELHRRHVFIVILSKAAMHRSGWVADECAWAYDLYRDEPGRTMLPVTGAPIETSDFLPDWIYLRAFRRIEAAGLQPFPPREAASRTVAALRPATAPIQRDATPKPAQDAPPVAPARFPPRAISPADAPSQRVSQPPAIPPERFPPRLAQLGFTGQILRGQEVIVPPLCDVPAGPFLMGSDPTQDREALDDEKPQHRVTLPAFQIARFPVTVAEYACFVRSGHAKPTNYFNSLRWEDQLQRLDHPVVNVSWRDAMAYAGWVAERTGQPWRLPSEAEWEKAARWDPASGHARIYPWGDQFDSNRCNTSESKIGTTPVGSYAKGTRNGASPCGAQDMAGNVWEWTASVYKPYPYTTTDDRKQARATENRVLRGGSWRCGARNARAAYRYRSDPVGTDGDNGFRLVRAVPSA